MASDTPKPSMAPSANISLATALKLANAASARARRSLRCRGELRNARQSFERATADLRHSASDVEGKGKV